MKKNSGFTLIEVLISMLVLAVGLLGLAGLQATGIKNNLSAYHRSQASILAYDLADRMRANIADAGNLGATTYKTNDPTTANVQLTCTTVSGPCTPAQMAENDLYEWSLAIAGDSTVAPPVVGILPLGEAKVEEATQGAAGNQFSIFTITINWDDNRDGVVSASSDPSFTMSFQL